jgi:trimeric autotransporter adhesin
MSTKTTFKRIALVTVAALGFGVLTAVAPATAANGSGAAASISTDVSYITVVGNTGAADSSTGIVRISLADALGGAESLAANETITAAVIGVPSVDTKTLALNAGDLNFVELHGTPGAYVADTVTAATNGVFNISNTPSVANANATVVTNSVYALGIVGENASDAAGGGTVMDKGYYTVRIRLSDSTGFVLNDKLVYIRFVSSAANADARITLATSGYLTKGETITNTTNTFMRATLNGATNSDRIQVSPTTSMNSTTAKGTTAPALAVALTSSTGTVYEFGGGVSRTNLYIADSGTAGVDLAASATAATTSRNDGVYGIVSYDYQALDSVTAATTNLVRVRYGTAQATATVAVYAPSTADSATSTLTVAAAGISVLNTASPYRLLTSTKSAVFTARALAAGGATGLANIPLSFTVAYSGNFVAGDVTPAATAVTTVFTDASGYATFTVTNANPVSGGTAVVTVRGFGTTAGVVGVKSATLNWLSAAPTTISVSPSSSKVKTKSATVITATVTDQWGAPVANAVLQPSVSGANALASGSWPTITTNASGQATFTLTDALGVEASTTLGSDSVTFTAASNGVASTAVTYTYVATLPVVASLTGYYALADNADVAAITTPLVTTGITQANGDYLVLNQSRNLSKPLAASATTTDEFVKYAFIAKDAAGAVISGMPVVVTAGTGGYIVNSSTGLTATSRTLVTATDGSVNFVAGARATGAITFTVTSGTATASAAQWVTNTATTDARFITLTGATTGTANGALIPMTATVTDRHGNPVKNTAISLTATGVGSFAGGSTTQSFTTDSTGTFTFQGTSLNAEGGSGTFRAAITSSGTDSGSSAGYVGANEVDSTLAAATSSASLVVTFAAGENAAAANSQAAADAAAEATDAANAATDAANAAAEAADAATAAAQDAADAVAALSTSVSAMISDLKRQITALTNLVIKIQRKVRA